MNKKIVLSFMGVLLLSGCTQDTISEKDFKKGLEKFIESEYNDNNYTAKLNGDKISVTYNNKEYILSYDLKENATFTYEVKIEEGISYDDYIAKTDILTLPMLGYISVLDTYGVEIEDAYTYFVSTYFDGMMDNYDEDKELYIITDDAEGFETDANIILISEFGDKVIEYVKNSYDENVKIEDSDYDTYKYELTTNCDENSCTFMAKLSVNPEGKFEEINGYADEMAKENMDENITPKTADYHIELAVGQSITISGKDLNGYEKSGMDVVEVESLDSNYVFKAIKAGVANGNFYIGDEETKTFYITVTDDDNKKSKDKTLVIK